MIPRRYTIPFALCLALIFLAGTGCPFITKPSHDPPPVDPTNQYLPQTTIPNVLSNLQKSYQRLNIDEYEKLFASNYTYIFAPQDVGGPDNNPPTWGVGPEIDSARKMFSKSVANSEGYVADQITLNFDQGDEIPNQENGWTKVILSNVYLTLITHKEDTGDPLNYEVRGDGAYLWFIKTGDKWYIVQWEDRPIPHKILAQN
jgi:hypothetical protein